MILSRGFSKPKIMTVLSLLVFLAGGLVMVVLAVENDDRIFTSVSADVPVSGRTTLIDIKLNGRPWTTFVPRNEEFSNYLENYIIVRDKRSNQIIDILTQGDSELTDFQTVVPSQYVVDNKINLILESKIHMNTQFAADVTDIRQMGAHEAVVSYEIDYGRPDDLPFIGDNFSYGEGTSPYGNWFHNKHFRWTFNDYELKIPIAGEQFSIVDFKVLSPVKFGINYGGTLSLFEASRGGRFKQDKYRMFVKPARFTDTSFLITSIDPLPGIQADLRELMSAIDSVQIRTLLKNKAVNFNFFEVLNKRFDLKHCQARSCNQKPAQNPKAIIVSLLEQQGGIGLPTRRIAHHNKVANLPRLADALVLIDRRHSLVANVSYDTGSFWMNSILGAALALDKLGYSVKYETPDNLENYTPKVVYIPSQLFYDDFRESDFWRQIKEKSIRVVFESSPVGDFFESNPFQRQSGISVARDIAFNFRDDFRDDGGKFHPTWTKPIYRVEKATGELKEVLVSNVSKIPFALENNHGEYEVVTVLTPLAYDYYNYGILGDLAAIKRAVNYDNRRPMIGLVSKSQVRAALFNLDKCTMYLSVENNNIGNYPYYGIARAYPIQISADRPTIRQVEVKLNIADDGNNYRVMSAEDKIEYPLSADKNFVLNDIAGDKLLRVEQKNCKKF